MATSIGQCLSSKKPPTPPEGRIQTIFKNGIAAIQVSSFGPLLSES
jgi:predicted Zn-dependent protease